MHDTGYRIQDARCRIQDTGYKMLDAGNNKRNEDFYGVFRTTK